MNDGLLQNDAVAAAAGWRASLKLRFDHRHGRTSLAELMHSGPLQVQKPFYPAPAGHEECHVYILHPPGGFVGDDSLEIDVTAESGTQALLTTPAAGKFYRVLPGSVQRQVVSCVAENGGSLAWVPQENIFFNGCHAVLETRVDVERGSHYLGFDISVFGREASGEPFREGQVRQIMRVFRGGRPVWLEHFPVAGSAQVQTAPWGMDGASVVATALLYGEKYQAMFSTIQHRVRNWDREPGCHVGVTQKEDLLILRYLGRKVGHGRSRLEQILAMLDGQTGVSWSRPRIWNT